MNLAQIWFRKYWIGRYKNDVLMSVAPISPNGSFVAFNTVGTAYGGV